jgi:arginyl-tRNA synthetase
MSPREEILKSLKKALTSLKIDIEPEIEPSSVIAFGDYTSNIALKSKTDPRKIAEKIEKPASIEKIEVKNGFINFFLAHEYLQDEVHNIIKLASKYGSLEKGKGKKARVEFISANPTGPLHIGNARGGPLGDVITNVLEKVGYEVVREYLHNNVGGQVKKLGEAIYYTLNPKEPHGELSYQGEYIKELALKVSSKAKSPEELGEEAVEVLFNQIIDDVKAMGIKFDEIYKESELQKFVPEVLEDLKSVIKEKDGALWFAPSDEFLKDRETVVKKSDGEYTYFASDIVYHKRKFESGAEIIVNVLGANHSGHVPRLQAAIKVLGHDVSKFKPIIYQYVRLKKGDEVMKMSKRTGDFITAREVLEVVGKDAFRYFLLTSSPETHMDFDMELASKKAKENPVFYIQYAYARISSVFGKVNDLDLSKAELSVLKMQEEVDLLRHLVKFPELIEEISQSLYVHQLTNYAYELANYYHRFYETQQILSDDKDLSTARLALSKAAEVVLKENLTLLGIESPKKM